MIKRILALFSILFLITSCVSNKKIVYLSESNADSETINAVNYANVLQPDDNLVITVTADEPELAAPFNLMYLNLQSNQINSGANNDVLISYLIDSNGEIDFAGLGKVKLAGLTRVEAEEKIRKMLEKQITNPSVNLRVINFKVSVIGEVNRPGPVNVVGDRITLLEALGTAGDMTIYGKRKEIMVIRDKDGVVTLNTVDITSADFIKSEFFYLDHNDVVYVKPNKTKVNSSIIGPNLTVGISAISLIVTIIALSTR